MKSGSCKHFFPLQRRSCADINVSPSIVMHWPLTSCLSLLSLCLQVSGFASEGQVNCSEPCYYRRYPSSNFWIVTCGWSLNTSQNPKFPHDFVHKNLIVDSQDKSTDIFKYQVLPTLLCFSWVGVILMDTQVFVDILPPSLNTCRFRFSKNNFD